jgi:hypothetical protein
MGKLQEKAILVRLSFSAYRGRKEDKKAESIVERETGAKRLSTKTYKFLLKDHISAISNEMNKLRIWHYDNTLPWARGVDILPTKKYFDYLKNYQTKKMAINTLVNEAIAGLNEAVTKDRENLGNLFNITDYPTEREFRKEYQISLDIMPVPSKEDFRVAMQNEEVEALQKALEESSKEKEDFMKKEMFNRLYEPIKHMVTMISSGKVLHKTLTYNIEKMCGLLKDLNITDDPEVDRIVNKVENELAKVDVDDLKNDEVAKEVAKKKAEDILKKMEGYL